MAIISCSKPCIFLLSILGICGVTSLSLIPNVIHELLAPRAFFQMRFSAQMHTLIFFFWKCTTFWPILVTFQDISFLMFLLARTTCLELFAHLLHLFLPLALFFSSSIHTTFCQFLDRFLYTLLFSFLFCLFFLARFCNALIFVWISFSMLA